MITIIIKVVAVDVDVIIVAFGPPHIEQTELSADSCKLFTQIFNLNFFLFFFRIIIIIIISIVLVTISISMRPKWRLKCSQANRIEGGQT